MKAWADLKSISLPLHMQSLARDHRGYPIPEFAAIVEGQVDFRVVDPQRWFDCLTQKRCAICGKKMEGLATFVGGPMSMQHRMFNDAPMHHDCATYAMQACPMLAAPKFAYAKHVGGVEVNPNMSTERPEMFGLGMASMYQTVRQGQGLAIIVWKWERDIEWWKHGKKITEERML